MFLNTLIFINVILMIAGEISKVRQANILSQFVIQAAIFSDRLDVIEKTLIKLLTK